MKKLLTLLCSIITPVAVSALPIGNPWEASLHRTGVLCETSCPDFWTRGSSWCDALSLRLGYYGDFVFDRHLQVDRKNNHAHIHNTKIRTNAAYVALNGWNRVDVFSTFGASQLHLTSANTAMGTISAIPEGFDFIDIDTNTDFSWSIGLRGTLWECGCFGIGAEAQYFWTRPDIRYVSTEGADTTYLDRDLKFQEWQVGLGASYRINISECSTAFVPYLGVKWNRTRVDSGNAVVSDLAQSGLSPTLYNLKNERCWGWAVGLTLLGCNKTSVTAEARFNDEKALYINGQLRF